MRLLLAAVIAAAATLSAQAADTLAEAFLQRLLADEGVLEEALGAVRGVLVGAAAELEGGGEGADASTESLSPAARGARLYRARLAAAVAAAAKEVRRRRKALGGDRPRRRRRAGESGAGGGEGHA